MWLVGPVGVGGNVSAVFSRAYETDCYLFVKRLKLRATVPTFTASRLHDLPDEARRGHILSAGADVQKRPPHHATRLAASASPAAGRLCRGDDNLLRGRSAAVAAPVGVGVGSSRRELVVEDGRQPVVDAPRRVEREVGREPAFVRGGERVCEPKEP